jgi:tRNA1(Val) A37 N6-methylase TrmN6
MSTWLKRIEHSYIKPFLRGLKPYSRVRYGGIEVLYRNVLDGGGTDFGQDFIRFFRERRCPQQDRIFEWCAGPGFIGFSLMANGFCKSLCLADINLEAVRAARATVRANNLAERVSVYHSDNLGSIPSREQWNVVVSNPPHFADDIYAKEIRWYDGGWRLHQAFFRDAKRHLAPNGVIVLQENNQGSTPETFAAMIEAAGLKIAFVQNARPELTAQPHYYYLGIIRAGETPPGWAT